MKKIFFILTLIFLGVMSTMAQQESSNEIENKSLQDKIFVLEGELHKCVDLLANNKKEILSLKHINDSLCKQTDSLLIECNNLQEKQDSDRIKIDGLIKDTNKKVVFNQSTLKSRSILVGIIIIVIIVSLMIIYWYFTRRIKSGFSSIEEVRKAQDALQLAQTKMQEESIRLDNKLLELIEKLIEGFPPEPEPDHSLALKVADEIVRIEANLSRMDTSIKGYKQLSKAVQRIKDNFNANGYEIVDMLGKPYNDGMKVIANFVTDENLEEGQQIITRIIKPQVNFQGEMIQSAQIEVSQSE